MSAGRDPLIAHYLLGPPTPHPRFVKSTFDQRDRKKHDPSALVKSRNEPCRIVEVLEAVAGVRGEDPAAVAHACYDNTVRVLPAEVSGMGMSTRIRVPTCSI